MSESERNCPLILIIEDDKFMRIQLRHAMEEVGYRVAEASDGEQGLVAFTNLHPDMVLLDALMPVMDGFTCCTQLHQLSSGSHVPVLMITALEDQESVDRAFEAGAIDYITKPIHWAVLRQRVRRVLQASRATEELRQEKERAQLREEQLRLALDAAHMGTWDWNLKSGLVVHAPTTEDQHGLPLSSFKGTYESFLKRVHPEDQEFVEQAVKHAVEHSAQYDIEFRVVCPDRSVHWIATKGQVCYDSAGKAVGMTGINMDITERKRSEQKIREQAALLNITTDAIIVCGLDNKILFWNKGAERLYGWTAEEVLTKNTHELLYKQYIHQFPKIQNLLSQTGEWHGELRQFTKEDKEIIVESRWTLMRDEHNQPKSILSVNTDITDKKKLEKQFLRAQRMESLGTLASGIAHDLNNALAPILMSVQLLKDKLPDEPSQRLLKTLEINTKRGAELVKQVLSFARGLEGEHTLLDVGHLIREVEQIAKQTFSRAIEIHTNLSKFKLWPISGDATQLHQVLINLCVNARDAMPKGGVLSLSAENFVIDEHYVRMHIDAKVGTYVVLTVSDTGTGIPPEILDRIFEPFFTTKEFGQGTGLGLSTVVGIIKGHGGFVDVQSQVGKGTQFKVFLPATETADIQQFRPIEHQLPAGHGELILVVDDEVSICEVTKTSLESYAYRVITANDGIEAVVQYAQHKEEISAVLLDMMMPAMDGLTTIRTVQKINPQVKIIAVSGLVSNERVAEVAHSGVKTFLPKPYTTEQLLKTLHGVLTGK